MRKCIACGNDIGDNCLFCSFCGTKQAVSVAEDPQSDTVMWGVPVSENITEPFPTAGESTCSNATADAPAEEKVAVSVNDPGNNNRRRSKRKKILLAILIPSLSVLLVSVLTILFIAIFLNNFYFSQFSPPEGEIKTVLQSQTLYIINEAGEITKVNDVTYYNYTVCGSGKRALLKVYFTDDNRKLLYYDGHSVREFAEYIPSDFEAGFLSHNGTAFYYKYFPNDDDSYIVRSSCFIYEHHRFDDRYSAYSPDGKTISYTKGGNVPREYYYHNGEIELGREKTVRAIANDAKYIYYYNIISDAFYVQLGDDNTARVRLSPEGRTDVNDLIFNYDLSEAVFYSGGETYISVNGNAPFKIASEVICPLTGKIDNRDIDVYGINSFKGKFCSVGESLTINGNSVIGKGYIGFISDDYTVKVIEGSYGFKKFFVSDDGTTVFFQTMNAIYKINTDNVQAEPVKITEGKYLDFYGIMGNSTIVYVSDGKLFAKTGTDEAILLHSGTGSLRAPSFFKDKLYFVKSGKLYYFREDGEVLCEITSVKSVQIIDAGREILVVGTGSGYLYSTNGYDFHEVK